MQGKSTRAEQDEILYSVGTVSELSGVPKHRLRRWERKLGLNIKRNAGGARIYTKKDAEIFLAARQLREQGLELPRIKALLDKTSVAEHFPVVVNKTVPETEIMFEQRRKQIVEEMREAFKDAVKGITNSVVKEVVEEVIKEQAATLESNLASRLTEQGDRLTDDLVERFNSDSRNNKDIAIVARRQMVERRQNYLAEQAAKPPKPKLLRALDIILGKE